MSGQHHAPPALFPETQPPAAIQLEARRPHNTYGSFREELNIVPLPRVEPQFVTHAVRNTVKKRIMFYVNYVHSTSSYLTFVISI